MYAAGEFTEIRGQFRASLAEIRTTNGNPNAWAPNPNGPVYALESDGTTLWAGGQFSIAAGIARGNLAAFDFATGALGAWQPAAVGRVDDLHRVGTTMYVSGAVTSLAGQARGRLGAVDATSGALLPFDAAANQDVYAIFVQGSTVYAGGKFSSIGGQSRNFLAALDAATGAATAWTPSVEATVRVLAPQGTKVFAGGAFRLLGGVPRKGLAAFDLTTKEATAWNPGVIGYISSFAVGSGKLFVGGSFGVIAGQTRSMLAAFDLADGALSSWDAQVGPWNYWFDEVPTTVPPRVNSLSFVNGELVVGGTFGSLGGQSRQHVGAVDATTALATAWNPGIQNVNAIPQCFAVNADADAIFIGGRFSQTAGQPRLNIAVLDPKGGGASSLSHDPNGDVKALERSETTVYVGGYYSEFGGLMRSGLAAFDATSGVTLPWNPGTFHSTYPFGGFVYALEIEGTSLYVGGDFHGLGGSPRGYVGAVDAVSGSLLAWDPNADGRVYDILLDGGRVFVAGDFGKMGGEARRGIAVFDALPVVGVTPNQNVVATPRVLSSAPSPAAAGAFLRFALPRATSVSLAMYDASGRHVRTVVEGRTFDAGEQRVPLEAGLAPGLYFLRLEADGQLAHGKVVIAE